MTLSQGANIPDPQSFRLSSITALFNKAFRATQTHSSYVTERGTPFTEGSKGIAAPSPQLICTI
jgi:hypothetical protein